VSSFGSKFTGVKAVKQKEGARATRQIRSRNGTEGILKRGKGSTRVDRVVTSVKHVK